MRVISSFRFVRRERNCSAGIQTHFRGLNDEQGLILHKGCCEQRSMFSPGFSTYTSSPAAVCLLPFCLGVGGSGQPFCAAGGEKRHTQRWLHLPDVMPPMLCHRPVRSGLSALSLQDLAAGSDFQGQACPSLLIIPEAPS